MDKLLHFIFSFFGVIIIFKFTDSILTAIFWMLCIGFIKELIYDFLMDRGKFEIKDVLSNIYGITIASILLL